MRRETLAHLLLLAVTLVWGTTFVLVKAALADASPLVFNVLRMALAGALLLALYRRRLRRLSRKAWLLGCAAGVFLAAGYGLQTSGLRYTTPAISAFLTGMVVVFVPILALSRHLRVAASGRPGIGAFAGAALGFAGLGLLAIPAGQPWAVSSIGHGEALTIGCAFAFTLHLLTLGRAAGHISYQPLAALQIAVAALVLLLSLPLFEPHPFLRVTPTLVAALLVSAVFATAAAFAIQSWAQSLLPPSHTALLLSFEPVFAAAASYVFLGQALRGRQLAGAGLVLAALVISELFPAGGVQPSAHDGAPLSSGAD